MEVLISMFILAVGLLGVAALIPAGRHEIVEATKLDNAAMVGRGAFRDMQVRGFLNPAGWSDVTAGAATFEFIPASQEFELDGNLSPDVSVLMDPLGVSAGLPINFPAGYTDTNVQPIRRIVPFQPASNAAAVFDSVFRSSFDQILEPNATNKDFPPSPKWFSGNSRRASDGNYSWIATITSDYIAPAVSKDVDVSIAVFYKRDMSGAREFSVRTVEYPGGATFFAGDLILRNLPTDPLTNKPISLRPGQWVMLAGMQQLTTTGKFQQFYKWYRVVAAGVPDATARQQVTLAGSDWRLLAASTRVFITPGIVSVIEKRMPLEVQ